MQETCRGGFKLEVLAAPLGRCRVLLPRLSPRPFTAEPVGGGTQTLTFEAKAKDGNPGAELFAGLDRAAAGSLSACLEAGWQLGTWSLPFISSSSSAAAM